MLTLLILRGELDLGNLTTNRYGKMQTHMVKVAADYQMFLCRVLESAVFLLSITTIEEKSHKIFLETAMSICFFRIP